MAKKVFLFTIILILFILDNIKAENFVKRNNIQLETRLHYGFLLSHHLELNRFNSHFPMYEISIQKLTYGQKRWEQKYDYPLVGFSLLYSDLGGYKELGNVYAAFPYLNFPLFRKHESTFNLRLGLGLSWLENKFDNITNYKNFAIGSHLNLAASIQFEYRRQINKRFTLSCGTTLTHFSNGTTKTPNYGLNIFTANIAVSYSLYNPKRSGGRMLLPELYTYEFDGRQYLEMNFVIVVSNKDMTQSVGKRFMVYASHIDIMKRVSYKSKFGIGIDLTADLSDKYFLDSEGAQANPASYLKTGISGGYELVISRMSILTNIGLYVGGKVRKSGDSYQRFTLKYHINENFTTNLALNTHAGTADFIGIGLGYRFRFIYKRKIKHS
ncbi:MAG: hypothetical protein C0595_14855 [Marinilabiliales bacterium]|nr:MAG: hypothetical protein C0595_14855 [Marinilabiliales bacterium]